MTSIKMAALVNSKEESLTSAKTETATLEHIVPGLSNLDLNIMFETDFHVINDAITGLSTRLEVEHKIVINVLQNMIAILKGKSSRGKIESRKCLEAILERDPRNLNALADIELLLRGLHRISEADKYKERLNRILQSSEEKDKQSKAICLYEQGYAILYEESANVEHIARHKLSESYKMLLSEYKKGKGKRKDLLQRGIYHNKQALTNLQMAMECKRTSELHTRRLTSLEKFKQANAECIVPNKPFWSFYEGVALNREYDSLQEQSLEDGTDLNDEMKGVTLNAAGKFWNIIANMSSHDTIHALYIARSLALLGHILLRRKLYFEDLDSNMFPFATDHTFKLFLKTPVMACHRALSINRSDTFVLNRAARVLWNVSEKSTLTKKKETLHEAQRILTESLAVDAFNWFAYSTRMSVRKDLALIYIRSDQSKAKMYLELAINDGYQCFVSKGTPKSIGCLAELCQYLAKFPNIRMYGTEHVIESQKHYLLDAIDYLNYGIQQSGPTNYFLSYRMGACLYDLGEYKSAVDWMKRALSLASNNFPLKLTCQYMLKRYRIEIGDKINKRYLLKEIVYTMLVGENKYGKMDDVFTFLFRHEQKGLINVLGDMVTIPHILDAKRKHLIQDCLNVCIMLSENDQDKCISLKTYMKEVSQLQEISYIEPSMHDRSSLASIPVDVDALQISQEFEYDFFVSHSHHDSDWVISKLVSDLESAFTEDDIVFKGCIADRDFKPGRFIFDNIEHSITRSYKVILVLTRHFVDSYWCQFETNQALINSIESRSDCVIPLLLEECEIPDRLQHITYADFTNDDNYIFEIMKLKKALLPGD